MERFLRYAVEKGRKIRVVYTLDGKNHEVVPGSAMLTRPGSTHSIRQTGAEDLVLLINYRKQQ